MTPTTVRLSDDVLFQQIGDEIVLMNIQSDKYFGLDEVAARFWQLFAEDGSTARAIQIVSAEYATDVETVQRDLASFLTRLAETGLITVEP